MPRPQIVGVRCAERFVGWAWPVVGFRFWCTTNRNFDAGVPRCGGVGVGGPLDTLLGFEATGPPSLRPVLGNRGGCATRRVWGRPVCAGWWLSLHLVVGCGVWFVDSGCEHQAADVRTRVVWFLFEGVWFVVV